MQTCRQTQKNFTFRTIFSFVDVGYDGVLREGFLEFFQAKRVVATFSFLEKVMGNQIQCCDGTQIVSILEI